jgi:hypothetical protein
LRIADAELAAAEAAVTAARERRAAAHTELANFNFRTDVGHAHAMMASPELATKHGRDPNPNGIRKAWPWQSTAFV